MKAINRNLCILFFFVLLSTGGGVLFSFKKAPQTFPKQTKDLALIDKFGIAIRPVILQFKMPPITIASVAKTSNYRYEPPRDEWHVEYGYLWGPNGETTHEGGVGVREYDRYGNYKEVTAKQRNDGTCEGTYNRGYEEKKDQSRKIPKDRD